MSVGATQIQENIEAVRNHKSRWSWQRLNASLLVLVLVAVLPVFSVLIAVVYLMNGQQRDRYEAELMGIARSVLASADTELTSTLRLAEALAAEEGLASDDLQRFDSDVRRVIRTQPNLQSIILGDLTSHTNLVHTGFPSGQAVPAGPMAVEQGQEVARTGKPTIFGLHASGQTASALSIPVRAPVLSGGPVTRVVTLTLSPTYLSGLFAKIDYNPAWTGVIVDPHYVIAASNRFPEKLVNQRVSSALEEALRTGKSRIFPGTNLEGQKVYSVFVRSAVTGWTVGAGIPAEEIDGPIRKATLLMAGAGLLAGGASIGVAAFFGIRLRRARRAEQQFSQSLEWLVAERTAELRRSEEQLRQAQKMEAVGQLTSGVAHDFNNLLGVVIGNLDLIEPGLRDQPQQHKYLQTAVAAVEHGAALTRQLLAFSRRQRLSPRRIGVAQLINGMSDILRRTLGAAIEVVDYANDQSLSCYADPAQIESAILNLAINARDAMPDGGKLSIEVAGFVVRNDEIDAAEGVSPGEYVMISVSDTGTGMEPGVRERAIEPFFTTKEVGKGSGLGLSMVYGFARQSGGFFRLESEVGKGTTARIFLPVASGLNDAALAPTSKEVTGGAGEVILTVEDNLALRKTAVEALHQVGYVPVEASDANEALAVLTENSRVRLLLTDIILPGGRDGFALADEAQRFRPDLKVLFMSGYSGDERIERRKDGKGICFLQKPFRSAELLKAVAEALGKVPA